MMTELLEYSLLCAISGALAGFLAGLFGVGGGIIIVPALYYLFMLVGLPLSDAMAMAVATSLATILPTAISSLRAHHRLENIDWPFVRAVSPGLVFGAISGALLVSYFAGYWLSVIFGVTLMGVAWLVFKKGRSQAAVKSGDLNISMASMRLLMTALAMISSLAGVGGGALGSPLLVASGFRVHRAVGTAASFGVMIALPSIVLIAVFSTSPANAPPYSLGLINLPAWFLISAFTVVTAPWGAKFGKRLSAKRLSLILAIFLFLLALKMLISAVAYYWGHYLGVT
ncbi:putative membrane protein YfcA [Alteromonadaceae bacterium 2753L.S.0a.02]|nr:putative membrane protein YfcA [Alteromonadaceae bacterium 2753L.S.0a.02]